MSDVVPGDASVAKLKDEGNALFGKQDYVGASQKYSEAIALDDKNAVLYSNRAACFQHMGRQVLFVGHRVSLLMQSTRYLDALSDSEKVSAFS